MALYYSNGASRIPSQLRGVRRRGAERQSTGIIGLDPSRLPTPLVSDIGYFCLDTVGRLNGLECRKKRRASQVALASTHVPSA